MTAGGGLLAVLETARALLGQDQPFALALVTDTEGSTAWLVDCRKADALWGPPSVALDTLLDWTAAWVMKGHKSLDKPTHFEVRDGHY